MFILNFYSTLAVTTDGVVFAWGSNYKGKLGVGDQESRYSPCRIPEEFFDFQPVAQVSAGGIHSAAITREGLVYTWGSGKDGRLGHLEMESPNKHTYCSYRPKRVDLLPDVERRATQISCSHYHTVALMELR